MVQILPEIPSFGTQFARNFGAGISQGLGQATQLFQQLLLEKHKKNLRSKLINEIENPDFEQNKFAEQITEDMPKGGTFSEKITESSPDSKNEFINKIQQDPLSKAKKYAVAGEHELARISAEENKLLSKERAQERKESYDLAKPTLDRARELAEDLPYKRAAHQAMQDAISSGELGFFTLNNLAEITGIEGLRSPKGAAFKTASKEFFLGNLSRVGSRGLNQMMEKVVQDMGPKIGRKTEANLAINEILNAENDVINKEIELTNKISRDYRSKYGKYPEDLSERVLKELQPYAIQRQKEALKKIEGIEERYKPISKSGHLMRDPSGNLRRVPKENYKAAKEAGYRDEK